MDNMQIKQHQQGTLEFINVKSEHSRREKYKTKFLFNGEYYSSEYVVVEYFKSKGYDAFFSENTTWKNLLRVLFKDIFKKFEKMGKKKKQKENKAMDEQIKLSDILSLCLKCYTEPNNEELIKKVNEICKNFIIRPYLPLIDKQILLFSLYSLKMVILLYFFQ